MWRPRPASRFRSASCAASCSPTWSRPAQLCPRLAGPRITLTLGWGTVTRVDLLPATCGDPACDADHGFDGTIASDDLVLRISADADGDRPLGQARDFAAALSARIEALTLPTMSGADAP